jgi:four helix bundle protein
VQKELRESRFWLRFLVKTGILDAESLAPLSDECGQLCNIIAKSIVTAKRNRKD